MFIAAFAGALAGMGASDRVPTDPDPADYNGLTEVAGAFAQSFDTEWGALPADSLTISTAQELCEVAWQNRSPINVAPFNNPANYTGLSRALKAMIRQGGTYMTSIGVIPPGPPGGGGATLLNYTVFVGKNGNDATADGSLSKPFLTVQAAMEYAYTTHVIPGSPDIRPCVYVAAGLYNDGPLTLPPQICVLGQGYNHTRILGDWQLDARWENPPANDFRSSLRQFTLQGNALFDFLAYSSNEGKVYADNVRFSGTVDAIAFSSINQLLLTDCQYFGKITLTGCNTNLDSCNSYNGAEVELNQGVSSNNFGTHGGTLAKLTINGLNPLNPWLCNLTHAVQQGEELVLNGPHSTVNAGVQSIPLPSLVTLLGGAADVQIERQNAGDGLFYSPDPAQWVGTAPYTVSDAIDRMATLLVALNSGPIP